MSQDFLTRGKGYATEPGSKVGTVKGYAVFDHDAGRLAQPTVFDEAETAYASAGRQLGKTGELPERNLSVVKIVEA